MAGGSSWIWGGVPRGRWPRGAREAPVPAAPPPQDPAPPAAVDPDGLPVVEFLETPCPHCGCRKTRVKAKKGSIRYHRCRRCECDFKSFEVAEG